MKWQKLGQIWTAAGETDWARTHAALPLVRTLSDDRWSVYVTCRDQHGKSRIGRLILDVTPLPHDLPRVVEFKRDPIVSLGAPGTFDDSGAMSAWLVENEGELRLYYIGWSVVGTVPYHVSIGLAISRDGGETFQRASEGPVFGRCVSEPYFATSACVRRENDHWRLWYASGRAWQEIDGRWEPTYFIRHAESSDGVAWSPTATCIDLGPETAICRPTVFKRGDKYCMINSYRAMAKFRTDPSQAYRLGYAESADGIAWDRKDEQIGISRSAEGWDSEMIEYTYYHQHLGETYLLYNGNGFGRSGFGIARLVEAD
jgi:hypothetical protein